MTRVRILLSGMIGPAAILLSLFLPALSHADVGEDNFPSVTLWPLAYHQQDAYNSRTDILYPIFHYKREGSHERFAIRPFLFNKEKDPARDFRQLNLLWPLTQFKTEGESFENYVFPFYYQALNQEGRSLHLWPFFGHSLRADGTETWSTIYPFFQYRRNDTDGSRRIDYFWPLGRVERSAESSSNYLLPLWWIKKTPTLKGRFILPYFSYQSETSDRTALFPLWYRLRAETERTDLLLPFWYAHADMNNRFRTFFPLYWDYRKGADRKLSLLLPLYGQYLNRENDYQLVFPFYFRHTNSALESELRYYFPFYGFYRQGEAIQHVYYLFPLYAHIQDQTVDREAWYFLWPLIYRDSLPDSSETWAVPLFWMKKTPERETRLALIPPYYYLDQKDGRKEVHYWPLYGFSQDQTYSERSLVWPLFRWGSSPSGDQRGWQFLLLYNKIEPQREMLGFFPLWHYDRKADRTRNVSLVHWHEKTEQMEQFSLFHLANPDWSLFSIKKEPTKRHHHLFPLYSYTRQAPTGGKRFDLFGPVYRYRRESSDSVSHQFLWKVLYAERTPDRVEKGFLWRLIRTKQDAEGSLFEFNPFYYSEKRNDGRGIASWLGGIYAVRNDAKGDRHTLFWLINW